MATLVTEKEQLDTETQSLEKRKTELERGNRWIEKTIIESKAANKQLNEENAQLAKDKNLLVEYNSTVSFAYTSLREGLVCLEWLEMPAFSSRSSTRSSFSERPLTTCGSWSKVGVDVSISVRG